MCFFDFQISFGNLPKILAVFVVNIDDDVVVVDDDNLNLTFQTSSYSMMSMIVVDQIFVNPVPLFRSGKMKIFLKNFSGSDGIMFTLPILESKCREKVND